jgi:choline dehydrogenase
MVSYSASRPVPLMPGNPPGEALGLVRSDPALGGADLQMLFLSRPIHPAVRTDLAQGYSIMFSAVTPRSRGSVRLASADPEAVPLVDPNYLGDDRDVETMTAGLRLARQIGCAEALAPWRGEEAPAVSDPDAPAAVLAYLRGSLMPYFHYAGTCRIGIDDMAVVDPELRVRGLDGLRVADASVMPSVVSANTNATVCAIAERAAALIAE